MQTMLRLLNDKFKAIIRSKTGFKNPIESSGADWYKVQAISTAPPTVHYELLYSQDKVFVCFHNESHGNSYAWKNYAENEASELRNKDGWRWPGRIDRELIDLDQLEEITTRLIDDVSPVLKNAFPNAVENEQHSELLRNSDAVSIAQKVTVTDLLKENLTIPEYQRDYCWRTEDVIGMFSDISNFLGINGLYHLGTVILKKAEASDAYEIIDGQQRLTTLAIWEYVVNKNNDIPLLKSGMKHKNPSIEARNALLSSKQSIEDFDNKNAVDLNNVVLSVIVIGKEQPDDLAYTFFSNNNSTGKRLSDFDLLKTHHLRYIKHEGTASLAVKRWHELEKNNVMEPLLHYCLFRLRNWRSGKVFSFDASSNPDNREIYHHFSYSIDENPEFASMQMPQFNFDSILPGGQTFFDFTEYYRRNYEVFQNMEIIRELDQVLGWHSNGVIRDGIKAIAFLFYCKFGASYLNEAVYALSYWLSQLRNSTRVMRTYINDSLFQETTSLLDRVTTASQFLSSLLEPRKQYIIENTGNTAQLYWYCLGAFLKEIEQNANGLKAKDIQKSSIFAK